MSGQGLLGVLIYGVFVPTHLYQRLKKASQDEGEQRFDPEFMKSHGWLVRQLRQWLAR